MIMTLASNDMTNIVPREFIRRDDSGGCDVRSTVSTVSAQVRRRRRRSMMMMMGTAMVMFIVMTMLTVMMV